MTRWVACLVLLLGLTAVMPAEETKPPFELPKPDADGKISIFNGKDLSGWYGDMELYKVENGEIVGKTAAGIKENQFLKSRFVVGDFRLVLQIKLTPNSANSGIQFRSVPFHGNEMKGYQADAGQGWWGKLYEESGRGLLTRESGERWLNKEDWNTYEIVAVGHKIMTALNGHKCVDLEDTDQGSLKGIFGLQVHAGGPTEVRFKDLKLELNPKAELSTVKK